MNVPDNLYNNFPEYWEFNFSTKEILFSDELNKVLFAESSNSKINFDKFLQCVYSEDKEYVNHFFEHSVIKLKTFSIDFRLSNQNNLIKYINLKGQVILDDKNIPIKIKGFGFDNTVEKTNYQKLNAQIRVIQILSNAKNLKDEIPNILKIICESINWQIGELWLSDYSVNLLTLEGSWSNPTIRADEFIEVSKKCKFGFGVSLQGRAWESGKALWSSNVVDEQFFPRTNLAAKLNLKTSLAYPIEAQKKILGIMTFYKNSIEEPDSELLNMLGFLGKQIGNFIEREKNEPSLHESEGLYKTLVEISPDAITYTDLGGKILFCNQQAVELFGFDLVEELIGQNIYAFTAPEDQNNAIKNENLTIEQGKTKNIEYTLIKRNGTRFYAEVNTSIVRDISGKPKAFIGVIRDITKRKLTEEEIITRIEQQAAIEDFGQFALTGHNIPKLMNRAVEILTNTLKVEFCELLELLPDEKTLLLTAGIGWKKDSIMQTKLNIGIDSHAGFTLQSNEPIVVENYQNEKRFKASKLLRDHKIVSGITVVIKGKDKPIGILGLHSTKPRIFTKNDFHFLQAIANILAIGIGRKSIEDELTQSLNKSKQLQLQAEESKNKLQLLSESSIILNSSLDYFQTIKNVANQVVLTMADMCIIDLNESNGIWNYITSNSEIKNISDVKYLEGKLSDDLHTNKRITKIIETKEGKVFNHLGNLFQYWNIKEDELIKYFKSLNFNSAIIVAIKIRDKVIGVISLLSAKNNFKYSNEDFNLVEDLARRISTAVETARLFNESELLNQKLNRKAKERSEELEISNTELEVEIKLRRNIIKDYNELVSQQAVILELIQKSKIGTDKMQFMHEIVSIIPQVMKSEFCGIFEYILENKKLVLRAGIGWKPTEVGTLEIPVNVEYQEGYIILNNEKLIVENYTSNNKFILHSSINNNFVKSGFSVVINNKNRIYGVLSIYSAKNNNFTQDEIRFIKIIANLLSNVLEK